MPKSEFKFTPHKVAADERRQYGLVDVYDRATGAHLGMLNPIADGAYVLRDRTGERLSVRYSGRFDDIVYVSREVAAATLRQRIAQVEAIIEARAASVSAGCPNNWHNGSARYVSTACPECPTQPGLKLALTVVETLIAIRVSGGGDGGALDDAREEIEALVYALVD